MAAIVFNRLSYRYDPPLGDPHLKNPVVIPEFSLEIPEGARTLVVGANGVGKTTLLRILAGHHLVGESMIRVFGDSPFFGLSLSSEISLIDNYFPLNVDLKVSELLASGRNGVDSKLEAELLDLLGIQTDWRMNRVSDGQRRRVQLLIGLRKPVRLLLLDEVSSNLDVTMRSDLLSWLKKRSESQNLTILYATHIFDGLWDTVGKSYWPTHLLNMKFSAPPAIQDTQSIGPSLLQFCESEIRSDLKRTKRKSE